MHHLSVQKTYAFTIIGSSCSEIKLPNGECTALRRNYGVELVWCQISDTAVAHKIKHLLHRLCVHLLRSRYLSAPIYISICVQFHMPVHPN